MNSSENVDKNLKLIEQFETELENVTDSTKKEYCQKLRQMAPHLNFLEESDEPVIEFLNSIENPNTRSNKAFALLRLRRHFNVCSDKLEEYRDAQKKIIRSHRKEKAKSNNECLMCYDDLLKELDVLQGRKYIMNYLYCRHGLRNKDINLRHFRTTRAGQESNENAIVYNPKAKKPKTMLYINEYKTQKNYGPKVITVQDPRFQAELNNLNLKNGAYLFALRDGTKPTDNYMNTRARKDSIKQYGEGRIAKILVKHLIENKQFHAIENLSKQRGTALGTLYTHYNIMDNLDVDAVLEWVQWYPHLILDHVDALNDGAVVLVQVDDIGDAFEKWIAQPNQCR